MAPPLGSARPYLLSAGISVLAASLVVAALLRPIRVLGRSMAPTLSDGSVVLVDRLSFLWRPPRRGEVVIFWSPGAGFLVKRVVGLPGDRVVFSERGIAVNGRPPLPEGFPPPAAGSHEVIVPDGEYFVVGDNLPESLDSRRTGPVPRGLLVGRVVATAPALFGRSALSPAAAEGPARPAEEGP